MLNNTTSDSGFFLLRAADAVTNWRALAMTALAALAMMLSAGITTWMANMSFALGLVFAVMTFVVGIIAYSSVGILLMRKSQDQEIGFFDAILQAIFTVHRMLGVALVLFLIFLAVVIVAFALLLLCKIPVLGPLLYAFVLPFLTVALGLTIAGTMYVCFPLAAPSIWSGNTVYQTTARLMLIIRQRLFSVITYLAMLSLLVLFLSSIVYFILLSGYSATLGMSGSMGINPMGGGMEIAQMLMGHTSGLHRGYEAFGGGSDYMAAFGFASAILIAAGVVIPFLTFVNGSCLTYLKIVEGLDFEQAEEQLRVQLDEAKRKTQEMRDRATDKLNEARKAEPTAGVAAVSTQSPAPAPAQELAAVVGRQCVHCHASLAPDDVFCGECGTKNTN